MSAGKKELSAYLPEEAVPLIVKLAGMYPVTIRITRNRHTKLGDYRSPEKGSSHKISVNGTLNKYAFLITLVHELSHMTTYEKSGRRVKPHGKEWKQEFRAMMQPFMDTGCFPGPVLEGLKRHMANPMASTSSDPVLTRLLANYNEEENLHLDDIPEGAVFRTENGMTFRKGVRLRTRYKCLRLDNKRTYFVSGLARVDVVKG